MRLREALIQQAPSIELQRAAANEIARLDAELVAERERCARIVERINGWVGPREIAAEIRGETQILRA